jgi:hypothetical protein
MILPVILALCQDAVTSPGFESGTLSVHRRKGHRFGTDTISLSLQIQQAMQVLYSPFECWYIFQVHLSPKGECAKWGTADSCWKCMVVVVSYVYTYIFNGYVPQSPNMINLAEIAPSGNG